MVHLACEADLTCPGCDDRVKNRRIAAIQGEDLGLHLPAPAVPLQVHIGLKCSVGQRIDGNP